jgi:Autographiviridae endonuclease VII
MHPEARAAAAARWHSKNRDAIAVRQKAYREANKGTVTRPTTEKKCSLCLEVKAADAFPVSKYTRTGLDSRCKACTTAKSYAWNQANPEKFRANQRRSVLKTKYGLTEAARDALFTAQGNACAICRATMSAGRWKSWVVDHDHETGKVRGILCGRCNRALGFMGDSLAIVETAADYLRKS